MDFNPFLSIYNLRFSDNIERNWLLSSNSKYSNSNIIATWYCMPFMVYYILDYLTLFKFEISKINTFKLQRYRNMIRGRQSSVIWHKN